MLRAMARARAERAAINRIASVAVGVAGVVAVVASVITLGVAHGAVGVAQGAVGVAQGAVGVTQGESSEQLYIIIFYIIEKYSLSVFLSYKNL